jgi:hypothetical protein
MINGFDRVTDILFAFSGLAKVLPAVLKNAAYRGTKVHEHCDCLMRDLPTDEIDPKYRGYIDSFKFWATGKNFLVKPERFFCEKLKITGECDGIYEDQGKLILFDLKTPRDEGATWGLQGSAYAYMARLNGIHIDIVEFVRLNKDGTPAVIYRYGDMIDEFVILLNVYRTYFKNVSEIEDF